MQHDDDMMITLGLGKKADIRDTGMLAIASCLSIAWRGVKHLTFLSCSVGLRLLP
ncbi:MAG: hypothetical protein JRN52_03360 [Nitrososphaerota archaeon]|nr:hypothetical protein [Nitrososphaerota archaeon]